MRARLPSGEVESLHPGLDDGRVVHAQVALSVVALPGDGKEPPTAFRILKAGVNTSEKGEFIFDQAAAERVMAAYTAKGLDKLQIDYEHQSMVPPPGGGPAHKPAAGWFKPEVRGGELWATGVAWTAAALAMVAPAAGAPEYRYFSPILFFDQDTRQVTGLKNLALTNDPALDSLTPLAAASNAIKEKPMSECASCATLSAQVKDLQEKCTTLSTQLTAFQKDEPDKKTAMSSLTAVRSQLCTLTGQATEAAALGVLEAWKTKAAETDKLLAEKQIVETAALTAQMGHVLEAAVKAGKLPPALRALEEKGALAFGGGKISKEGVEYLTAKWGEAAALVDTKGKDQKAVGTALLTAADRVVGAEMGTDMVAFEKWKTEQLEKRAREMAGQ
jgi:phage I-like protein